MNSNTPPQEHTCMKVRFLDGIEPTDENIQALKTVSDVIDVERDPADPCVIMFKTTGCQDDHCKRVARHVAKMVPGKRIEWSSMHTHLDEHK